MSNKTERWLGMKRTMMPFVLVPLALLMVITILHEGAWVSSHSQIDDRRMRTRVPTSSSLSSFDKVPLYVITPSGRPALLTRGIFHMLPFVDEKNKCGFDVHWIIVHNSPDERVTKAPLFRNVFPWITELFAYNESSVYGDHERNVGIEHVLRYADRGLVYFLDDDNVLSFDLCRKNIRSPLRADDMYHADVYECDDLRGSPGWWLERSWRKEDNITLDFTLRGATDTGTWLTPVWLLRQEFYGGGTQGPDGVRWKLQKEPGSDGLFYTGMVKALLQTDGTEDRLEHIPPSSVKFHYNHLTRCLQPQLLPWDQWEDQLNASLILYRDQIREMQTLRESPSFSTEEKTDLPMVAFHDYVHILYLLRSSLQSKEEATYVETGVWKGASSIFMSRHPLHTNVIGIDGFEFEHQREEAEGYARHLKGRGTISWIKSDSELAIPKLQERLNGSSIDILLIDKDHRMEGVWSDFELYAPLVSEGGFIVFDGFMDTEDSAGVREAVLRLIQHGQINQNDYEVLGCLPNTVGAGPLSVDDKYHFDWQSQVSNEFVLRRKKK